MSLPDPDWPSGRDAYIEAFVYAGYGNRREARVMWDRRQTLIEQGALSAYSDLAKTLAKVPGPPADD